MKLRPIIQLKGFLRAIYNGNLYTLTRGSKWLAVLCHSWSGTLQPSRCLGLHRVGSTSTGRTTRTPVNKYRLPFQTPTSKRCLSLLGKKSWVTSLQVYSCAANFTISKSTCNYDHPSIKVGGGKEKKGCVLISQALRRELGIFKESRNQRTGCGFFWYVSGSSHTYTRTWYTTALNDNRELPDQDDLHFWTQWRSHHQRHLKWCGLDSALFLGLFTQATSATG